MTATIFVICLWAVAIGVIFLVLWRERKIKSKATPVVTAIRPHTPAPTKPAKIQITKVSIERGGKYELTWRVFNPNTKRHTWGDPYTVKKYTDSYSTARFIANEFVKEEEAIYNKQLLAYNPNGIDHWTNYV